MSALKVDPFHVSALPLVNALVDDAYSTPFAVKEVSPVPPLVVASVPARVTAPVVAVLGVNPVVPALNDDTPRLERLDQDGAEVPLLIRTWLAEPTAVNAIALAVE